MKLHVQAALFYQSIDYIFQASYNLVIQRCVRKETDSCRATIRICFDNLDTIRIRFKEDEDECMLTSTNQMLGSFFINRLIYRNT